MASILFIEAIELSEVKSTIEKMLGPRKAPGLIIWTVVN